jgi:hypothetical protein
VLVGAQTGREIKVATAEALLIDAQLVYTFEGGKGVV